MGRKGVSKRKPKRLGPSSNADTGGSSNVRSGDRSTVQSLVKDKGAPLKQVGMDRPVGSNKHHNKRD